MSEWWLSRGDGKTEGPLSTEALVQGLVAGQIPKRAHVCRVGDKKWVRVSEIDEIWEAANPEQIRTNITERPWFLNHADSGQHRLADADAEDERTQVLTPLPMVTPTPGAHPFVTPLPRMGTHRELLARQAPPTAVSTPLPRVVKSGDLQTPQPNLLAPIRAKVPTLDGISDSTPPASSEPAQEPLEGRAPALEANSPRVPERHEPQLVRSPQPLQSPMQKGTNPPLAQSMPAGQSANLGTLPLGGTKPGFGPHGLAPLGVAPLGAAKPLPGIPSASGVPVGIPSLQRPGTPKGPGPSDGLSGAQKTAPRVSERQRAEVAGATRQGALPVLPRLDPIAAQPRPVVVAQPPPALQPRAPAQPAAASNHASSAAIRSPSAPAPSITQPRPLSFGPGLPPATRNQQPNPPAAKFVPAAPAHAPPPTAKEAISAARSNPLPASSGGPEGLDLELELTEDDERTTIAQNPQLSHRTNECGSDEDELTTIAVKSPLLAGERQAPSLPVANAAADDEPTKIVSAADLPGGVRIVSSDKTVPSDEDDTILLRKQSAPKPGAQATPSLVSPHDGRPAQPAYGLASYHSTAALSADTRASGPLVSNPDDLMEEGEEEPAPPAKPQPAVRATRPNAEARLAPVSPPHVAVAPPSAPPPARRPRLPSAPSIVLRPEPIVHQEATQPAARALRRPGTVQLSYGTIIVILLGIALVALAVAYVLLRRQ